MQHFKFYFLIIISAFFLSGANAECNFGVNLGSNIEEVSKRKNFYFSPIIQQKNAVNLMAYAKEVCPSQKLGRSSIIFTFLEKKLYQITIQNNYKIEQGVLFNYVKKNYGDFKGSDNMEAYDGFNNWKKNDIDIVYIRELQPNGNIREELSIFNRKYYVSDETE